MKPITFMTYCAAAVMSATPAWAGFNQGDCVTLDGQPIFNVAACDGMSAGHRAWITQDRLDNALFLAPDKPSPQVAVARMNNAICVTVDGRAIVTADANSARQAGISSDQLAHKWAQSIKDFLADKERAGNYIASLKRPNMLGSEVAVVERRLYAPEGTVLPITLTTALDSRTAKAGDYVEGIVSQSVKMGNYALPQSAVVTGELVERRPGELGVLFTSLRLPSGTELPITANLGEAFTVTSSSGAHQVCTIGMPANEALSCRIPASVGVGTAAGSTETTTLVLRPGSDRVITVDQPLTAVLTQVTPVAVITGSHAM